MLRPVIIGAGIAGAIALGASLVAVSRPQLAYAAMAVIDSTNLVKNAETAAQTAQVQSNTAQQLQATLLLQKMIGVGTNAATVFTYGTGPQQMLGAVSLLKNAVPAVQGILGSGPASDPGTMKTQVNETLVSGEETDPDKAQTKIENRKKMVSSVAESGLRLGLSVSASTSERAGADIDDLRQQAIDAAAAEPGGNLRKQVSVLTLVNLKLLEQMQTLNSMSGQALALAASKAIDESNSYNASKASNKVTGRSVADGDADGSLFGK